MSLPVVACGFLRMDGTRCENAAMTLVRVWGTTVRVPCCNECHTDGQETIPAPDPLDEGA